MSTLPLPPAEVPVQSDMTLLAPFFREAVERVVADMKAWGYTPQVFETMRTNERQAFLYGFGRTYNDGRGIVTYSQSADDTWHGYGLAVDSGRPDGIGHPRGPQQNLPGGSIAEYASAPAFSLWPGDGKSLGLPVEEVVVAPNGRPFKLADKGKPVSAIFA